MRILEKVAQPIPQELRRIAKIPYKNVVKSKRAYGQSKNKPTVQGLGYKESSPAEISGGFVHGGEISSDIKCPTITYLK